MSKKVFDKSQRYEDLFFIKMPADLRWYLFIGGYRAEMNYLYALIVDKYNVEKGYAYPSRLRLAREYGRTPKTLGTHLEKLKEVGLIDYLTHGQQYVYVPLIPLSQEELFKKYPEAADNYRKAIAAEESERERSTQNWLSYKGYR